jgi:DNA-binding NtrC family response regulator
MTAFQLALSLASLLVRRDGPELEIQVLAFVVDRDAEHRVMVGVSLAFLGYEVMQFDRAEEAIYAARSMIPSLVLTDVFMPNEDGIEVLNAIGELHHRCRMIAMLRSQEALAAPLLIALGHLGAAATVVKPVDHTDLSAAVERVRHIARADSDQLQSDSATPRTAGFLQGTKAIWRQLFKDDTARRTIGSPVDRRFDTQG